MQASSTNSVDIANESSQHLNSSWSTKGKRRLPAASAFRALQAWIATLKMRILKMVICFRSSSDTWTRSPARSEVSYGSDEYWESPQASLSQILGYPPPPTAPESPPSEPPLSPKNSSPSPSIAELEHRREKLKQNYSEPEDKPSVQSSELAIIPVAKPRAEKREKRFSVLQGYPGDSPDDISNFGCLPRAKRNKYTRETSREETGVSCLPRSRKPPKVDLEQVNRLLREKRARDRANALIAWKNEEHAHAKRSPPLRTRHCGGTASELITKSGKSDNRLSPHQGELSDFLPLKKRPGNYLPARDKRSPPDASSGLHVSNGIPDYETLFHRYNPGYFLPTRHEVSVSAAEGSPRMRKSGNMLLDDDRLSRQEPVATPKPEAEDERSGAPVRLPDRQQQSPGNGKYDGHEFRNWKSHEGTPIQIDEAGHFHASTSPASYQGDNWDTGNKVPYRPPYPGSQASNQPWYLGRQVSSHFFNPRHHGPGHKDSRPQSPRQRDLDSPSKGLSQSGSPRTPKGLPGDVKVVEKFHETSFQSWMNSRKPDAERMLSPASTRTITAAVSSEKYFHNLKRVSDSEKPLAKKPVAVKNMSLVSTTSKARRSPKSRPQQAPRELAAHRRGTKKEELTPSPRMPSRLTKDISSRFHKPRKFHSNQSPDYEDFHFNMEQAPKKVPADLEKVMPYDLEAIAAQLKDEGLVFSEPIIVMNVNSSNMFPIITTDGRGDGERRAQVSTEESVSKQSVEVASNPQDDGKSQNSDSSKYSDAKDVESQESHSTNYSDSKEDSSRSSSVDVGEDGERKESEPLQTNALVNVTGDQGHTFSDAISAVMSTISVLGSKTGDDDSSSRSSDDDAENEPFYSSRDNTKDEANQMPLSADPTSASSVSSQIEEGPTPNNDSETERSPSYDHPLQDVTISASNLSPELQEVAPVKVHTLDSVIADTLLQLHGEAGKEALVTDFKPEPLDPIVTDTVQSGFTSDIVVTPAAEIVKTSIEREVMHDHHKMPVHPREEMYHRRHFSEESLIKPSPRAENLAQPQHREEPAQFSAPSQPLEGSLEKPLMTDESNQVEQQPDKENAQVSSETHMPASSALRPLMKDEGTQISARAAFPEQERQQKVSSETHMLVSSTLRPSMKDEGTQFSTTPAVFQQESQQQISSGTHVPKSSALSPSVKVGENQFLAKPAVSQQESQQQVSYETHMMPPRTSMIDEETRVSEKAAVSEHESPDQYSRPIARPTLNDNGVPFSKPGLYQVLEPPETTSGGRVLATSLARPVVVPEVTSQDSSLTDHQASPWSTQSMVSLLTRVRNESLRSSPSGVSSGRHSIIPLSEDSAQGNPLHIKIHSFLHSMASRSRSVELNNLIIEELAKNPALMDGRAFEGQLASDELDPSFVTPDSEDVTSPSMGNSNDADQGNVLERLASDASRQTSLSSRESCSSATDSQTHDEDYALERAASDTSRQNSVSSESFYSSTDAETHDSVETPKSEILERSSTRTQLDDTYSQNAEESLGPKLDAASFAASNQALKDSSGSSQTVISPSTNLKTCDLGSVVEESQTPGVLHPGQVDPSTLVSISTTDSDYISTRPVEQSAELGSARSQSQSSSLTEQTTTDPASDLEIPSGEDESKGSQHIKIHSFLHSMASRSLSVELDNLLSGKLGESSTLEKPRTREGSLLNPSAVHSTSSTTKDMGNTDSTDNPEKIVEQSIVQSATGETLHISLSTTNVGSLNPPSASKDPASLNKPENEDVSPDTGDSAVEDGSKSPKHIKIHSFLHSMASRSTSVELEDLLLAGVGNDSGGETSNPEEPRTREGSLLNPSISRSSSVLRQNSTFLDPASLEQTRESITQDSTGESSTPEEPRTRGGFISNPSTSGSSSVLRQNSTYIDPPSVEKIKESSTQDFKSESYAPEEPRTQEESKLNPSSSSSSSTLRLNSIFTDPTTVGKIPESSTQDSIGESQTSEEPRAREGSLLTPSSSRSSSTLRQNSAFIDPAAVEKITESSTQDSIGESQTSEEPRAREGSLLTPSSSSSSSTLRQNSAFIDPTTVGKIKGESQTPEEPRAREGSRLNPSSSRSSSILKKNSTFIDPNFVSKFTESTRSDSELEAPSALFKSDVPTNQTPSENPATEDQSKGPKHIKIHSFLHSMASRSTSVELDNLILLSKLAKDSEEELLPPEEPRDRQGSTLNPLSAVLRKNSTFIDPSMFRKSPTSLDPASTSMTPEEPRTRQGSTLNPSVSRSSSVLRKDSAATDLSSVSMTSSNSRSSSSISRNSISFDPTLSSEKTSSDVIEPTSIDLRSESSVPEEPGTREGSILNPSSSRFSSIISLNSTDHVTTPASERLTAEKIRPSSAGSTLDPSSSKSSSLNSRHSVVPDSTRKSETLITNTRQPSLDGSVLDRSSPRSPSRLSMKPVRSDPTPNLKKLIEGLQDAKPRFDNSEISSSATTTGSIKALPDSKIEAVEDQSKSPKHIKIHSFLHSMASRSRSVELDNLLLSAKLGKEYGGESSAPGPEESRSREGSLLNSSHSRSASSIAMDMANIDPRLQSLQDSQSETSTGEEARSREGSVYTSYTSYPLRSASSVSMDMANVDPSDRLELESRGKLSYGDEARTREASSFSLSPSLPVSSTSINVATPDPSPKFVQGTRGELSPDEEITTLGRSMMNSSASSSSATVIISAAKASRDPTAKSERAAEGVKKLIQKTTNELPDESQSSTNLQRLSTDQSTELEDPNPAENSSKSPKHIKIHSFLHSMAARSRSVELENLIMAGGNRDAPDVRQEEKPVEPGTPTTPQDDDEPSSSSEQELEPTGSEPRWMAKWKNDRFADYPPAPLSKVSRNDGQEPPPTTPSSGPPSTPPDQVEFLQAFWGKQVRDPLDGDNPTKHLPSSSNSTERNRT